MGNETCMYCTEDRRLQSLMIPVIALAHTEVYLFREISYPGRCVVAWKNHVQKFTDLSPLERQWLMVDIGMVADAITAEFSPDKVNYLIFGDESPHLHVHLVPKYRTDSARWGKLFEVLPCPASFACDEADYDPAVTRLRNALLTHPSCPKHK